MTIQAKSPNVSEMQPAQRAGKFLFWQRWLVVVSLALTAFGLFMAFFNRTPLFNLLFNHQIDPVFWGSAEVPPGAAAFQGWIYGVLGAVIAGWGTFLIFIAAHPFKQREKWAWNCILAGLLVWYVIDTFISLQFKVVFNAILNTALFIPMILPLVFTRKDFE
ncbi:MAG: hypothetical protein ACE5H9_07405 [Anaerolineae bacterium]